MIVESISVDTFLEDNEVRAVLDPVFRADLQAELDWTVPGVSKNPSSSGYSAAALIAVERISTIEVQGSPRATFRLTFADGSFGKCRILREPWIATRLCWMARNIPTRRIARMYASVGRAMLEEWVEGVSLTEHPRNKESRVRLGNILSRLHTIEFKQPYENPHVEPEAWRQSIINMSRHAAELGLLHAGEALTFTARLSDLIPASIDGGIVHNDCCSENLVLSPTLGLILVDNETLGFGAHDYDIARTRRREKLSPQELEEVLVKYQVRRSPESYLRNQEFWDLLVNLESTIFHAKYSTSEAWNEVELLRIAVADFLARQAG